MPQTENQDYHQMALPPGFQLEEYRLEDVLGKGGFGITYLASDNHLSHRVAIKELMPDGIATRVQTTTVVPQTRAQTDNFEWAQQRFIDEARALARLNHPNIVRVLRLLRANGTAYMVMEYIQGKSLEDWIKGQPGPPPEADLRKYLSAVLDGLEYIHKQGLFHRDIKPDNIFLRSDGQPVLIDFGSARADLGKTMMMTSVVTHGYSPFEQYQTQSRQGPYTDFYSLAAVMFRAVTGRKPPSAIDRISDDSQLAPALEAVKGQYSESFLAAIERGMAIKIDQRPQNADEFRQLLATGTIKPAAPVAAKAPEPVPAPPPMPVPVPQPEPAPVATTTSSVKVLLLQGLLGFFVASLWLVSLFHGPDAPNTTTVPDLLATVAAIVLPFCVFWPLISSAGQKIGAANLYLASIAGATVGTLLLSACAAAVLFVSNPTYQGVGARAFRIVILVEWILLWSAWLASRGLEAEGARATARSAWLKVSATICGGAAALLLVALVRSTGAHAGIFFPLGFSLATGALATILGLSMPRSVQPRQAMALRDLERQAEFPVWKVALTGVFLVLFGNQMGDFASLVAPQPPSMADFGWLIRIVCWAAGMAFMVLVLPRTAVRLFSRLMASASVAIPFLPHMVGYASTDFHSMYLGWLMPLLEGLLQGCFFGCVALMAAGSSPQHRVARGMFFFVVFAAVGGVLSAAIGLFLNPHLATLGYVPRVPFGEHAELWHSQSRLWLLLAQSTFALLAVAIIQSAFPSPKNKGASVS